MTTAAAIRIAGVAAFSSITRVAIAQQCTIAYVLLVSRIHDKAVGKIYRQLDNKRQLPLIAAAAPPAKLRRHRPNAYAFITMARMPPLILLAPYHAMA